MYVYVHACNVYPLRSSCAAPVMSCDWMPEGKQLVSGSWDRTAKLWDFESAQVIHSLEGERKNVAIMCKRVNGIDVQHYVYMQYSGKFSLGFIFITESPKTKN